MARAPSDEAGPGAADRAFRAEREARKGRLTAIQRDTAAEVTRLLEKAQGEIQAQLAIDADAANTLRLRAIERSIARSLEEVRRGAAASLNGAAGRAWDEGIAMIDAPLAAGLSAAGSSVAVTAALGTVDTAPLVAMRSFLTHRIRDIGIEAADRINEELGMILAGVRTPAQAADRVAEILGSGGRGRALTLIRTELGRAFETAQQQRREQAAKLLPGLKKQWRRSGKVHSRAAHDAADGQVRAIDEPFLVGGTRLMFPRDPAAPPAQTVNCGCTSLPYMESWTMRQPGRQPLTPAEITRQPLRRDIERELGEGTRRAMAPAVLETLPVGAIRAEARDTLRGRAFLKLVAGRGPEHLPVAALPSDLAGALGVPVRTVRLSKASARKQRRHHPELRAEDYARELQATIDEGDAVLQRAGTHLVIDRVAGDRAWRAVVKRTKAGDELYLASFHRITPRQRRKVEGERVLR